MLWFSFLNAVFLSQMQLKFGFISVNFVVKVMIYKIANIETRANGNNGPAEGQIRGRQGQFMNVFRGHFCWK